MTFKQIFILSALLVSFNSNAVLLNGFGLTTNAISGTTNFIDFEGYSANNVSSYAIGDITFSSNGFNIDSNYSGSFNTVGQHITNTNANYFRFDFANNVSEFAFVHGATDYVTTLSGYNGSTLVETFSIGNSYGSNAREYWGLSNSGMTHAILSFSSSDYIFIDDFAYSTDVVSNNNIPEPSIITLLGLGLAGLGFTRRKKRLAV